MANRILKIWTFCENTGDGAEVKDPKIPSLSLRSAESILSSSSSQFAELGSSGVVAHLDDVSEAVALAGVGGRVFLSSAVDIEETLVSSLVVLSNKVKKAFPTSSL